MQENLSFGGGIPQWQMAAPEEHGLDGGRELRGAFEGEDPHHRPIDNLRTCMINEDWPRK
jgi:hypothetical protein